MLLLLLLLLEIISTITTNPFFLKYESINQNDDRRISQHFGTENEKLKNDDDEMIPFFLSLKSIDHFFSWCVCVCVNMISVYGIQSSVFFREKEILSFSLDEENKD